MVVREVLYDQNDLQRDEHYQMIQVSFAKVRLIQWKISLVVYWKLSCEKILAGKKFCSGIDEVKSISDIFSILTSFLSFSEYFYCGKIATTG